MHQNHSMKMETLRSRKRQFDHADIDGKSVETHLGPEDGPEPSVPAVPSSSPDTTRPATEDDQDIKLPDDGPSRYGEDVERDSDA